VTAARTELAVSGARAATASIFGTRPRSDKVGNAVFRAVLFLGSASPCSPSSP
jgi:phosphate transport system permease protein